VFGEASGISHFATGVDQHGDVDKMMINRRLIFGFIEQSSLLRVDKL